MPLFLILITLAFGACAGPVSASNPSTASTPEDTEPSARTIGETPRASKSKFYTEPYTPPSNHKETSIGALIVDCERHLRTWQEAMARPRTPENAETIHWTEAALATVVNRDRQKLEQEAATGPPRNRAIASAALGFAPGPQTLTFLLNNLSSKEPIVLANTLLGIGAMSNTETPLNFLADILLRKDLPQAVIVNGMFAGHRLAAKLRNDPGGHLSRLFLGYIDFPDTGVRAQAASGLGLTRSGIAVEALAQSLRGDSEPLVRTAAAFALGEIGSLAGISALKAAQKDPSIEVVGVAAGSLRKIQRAQKP